MTLETRRFTRRELYERVWKTPVETLAKEFGMSGRGFAKLCERHGVPVPPRGYWARKAAGQKVRRPPLVELADARYPEVPIDLSLRKPADASNPADGGTAPSPYRELFDRQLAEIGSVTVPRQLRDPHRLIANWLEQEERDRKLAQSSFYGNRHFMPRFAGPLARRRLRILNTLLRELERRGFTIEEDQSHRSELVVRLGHDSVGLTLSERIRHVCRRLTEKEMAERHFSRQKWTHTKKPTGELELSLTCALPDGVPERWHDEQVRPLESRMAELLAGILTAMAHVRERREKLEAQERCRREREEEERRREEERRAELARQLALRQRAEAWRMAIQIRDYVAAVQAAAGKGEIEAEAVGLEAWSAWALGHADKIDPLRAGMALGTDLLWTEKRSERSGLGWAHSEHSLGDANWFWGRRWWLKG